jgi:hypothetical protein
MRNRSPTNSRPWENQELVAEYLKSHPFDELYPLLVELGFKVPAWQPPGRNPYEPHHLFGNMGQRWDKVTNIISVSPATHDWCHNHQAQDEWRIAALYIKLRKRELDLADFKTITGKYLGGWLSIHQPEHDGLKLMHESLMRFSEQT